MSQTAGDSFRDSLYNVDIGGRRVGFYPRKPGGRLYRARTWVSVFLLTILFAAPWIRIGGEPMLLFDFLARRFVIFGQVFWPQDFLLAAVAFLLFIVSIVFFTVVWGRVWCGWACPQTIFLEMVYRKIEYFIEGDSHAQKRLAGSPWTFNKIWKRVLKHGIFLFIAFAVAHTLLFYIFGTERLLTYVTESPAAHPFLFGFVILFTGVFYFIFAHLRELACIIFCPYGRLQGVFLDDNSIVISYDHKRGEPRTKIKGKEGKPEGQGDCIDCKMCVAVCPTGIDIRNGTQLECVNCTACIDACDEIMDKVSRPRGLIRYASNFMINTGKKFRFTGRMIAYSVVLGVLLASLGTLVMLRSDVQATITKLTGTSYRVNEAGNYENLFNAKFVNKTKTDKIIHLEMKDGIGKVKLQAGDEILLKAESMTAVTCIVELEPSLMTTPTRKLRIKVMEGDRLHTTQKIAFTGPF